MNLIQLPELAYARSDVAGQGRTVYGGVMFLDRATDVGNLYVAMTRGWATNEVFIAVTAEENAIDVISRCLTTDWIDQPAHIRWADLNDAPWRLGTHLRLGQQWDLVSSDSLDIGEPDIGL